MACLGTSTTFRRQLCLKSGGFDICFRQQNSKQFNHVLKFMSYVKGFPRPRYIFHFPCPIVGGKATRTIVSSVLRLAAFRLHSRGAPACCTLTSCDIALLVSIAPFFISAIKPRYLQCDNGPGCLAHSRAIKSGGVLPHSILVFKPVWLCSFGCQSVWLIFATHIRNSTCGLKGR